MAVAGSNVSGARAQRLTWEDAPPLPKAGCARTRDVGQRRKAADVWLAVALPRLRRSLAAHGVFARRLFLLSLLGSVCGRRSAGRERRRNKTTLGWGEKSTDNRTAEQRLAADSMFLYE